MRLCAALSCIAHLLLFLGAPAAGDGDAASWTHEFLSDGLGCANAATVQDICEVMESSISVLQTHRLETRPKHMHSKGVGHDADTAEIGGSCINSMGRVLDSLEGVTTRVVATSKTILDRAVIGAHTTLWHAVEATHNVTDVRASSFLEKFADDVLTQVQPLHVQLEAYRDVVSSATNETFTNLTKARDSLSLLQRSRKRSAKSLRATRALASSAARGLTATVGTVVAQVISLSTFMLTTLVGTWRRRLDSLALGCDRGLAAAVVQPDLRGLGVLERVAGVCQSAWQASGELGLPAPASAGGEATEPGPGGAQGIGDHLRTLINVLPHLAEVHGQFCPRAPPHEPASPPERL